MRLSKNLAQHILCVLALIAAAGARTGGIFWHFDMEWVDSALAVRTAYEFSNSPFLLNVLWEPIYTFSLWLVLNLVGDPHLALMTVRFLLYIAIVLMIFWVGRPFIGNFWAVTLALWWLLLPDALGLQFTKHLYYFAFLLLGCMIALRADQGGGRAVLLAFLWVGTLLLRNELAIAVLLFSAFLLVHAIRNPKPLHRLAPFIGVTIAAGLLSAAIAAYGTNFYGSRTVLAERFENKHTFNMCQIYAFGVIEREGLNVGSPWQPSVCEPLMQRDFAEPKPTFFEMLSRNPTAVFAHMLWNLSLFPSAAEQLLFGRHDEPSSDYTPLPWTRNAGWAPYALAAWGAMMLLLIAANREALWSAVRTRPWLWLYMLSVVSTNVVVMLTQRPRLSFLLFFGFAMMLATMLAVGVGLRRIWARHDVWRSRALPAVLLAAAFALLVPDFYRTHADHFGQDGRARYRQYLFIDAHYATSLASQPQHRWLLITPTYNFAPLAYLKGTLDRRLNQQVPISWTDVPTNDQGSAYSWVVDQRVNMAYFDDAVLGRWGLTEKAQFIESSLIAKGWRRIIGPDGTRLLVKAEGS